ncbi:ATP-binding protein [Streptomyces sp. NPDC006739]|uniref:ATP-binding protein n=1 Tax=Streptomyces sp. NPDC006739 TaxID=3364763 RepID=UPI003698DFA4
MNAEISTPTTEFTQRLSATPRAARLARRLTTTQLSTWGYPHDDQRTHTAEHIVAELAANAVTHGRLPARDFELRLSLRQARGTLRIEVSDARGDRHLRFRGGPEEEGGRGLVLVSLLALRWGVMEREVGKTVWADVSLAPRRERGPRRPVGPLPFVQPLHGLGEVPHDRLSP